jgi:hypothetical protein
VLLPTARCPSCNRFVLVYRSHRNEDDRELETRCADCDTRLDRFGLAPVIKEESFASLAALGYEALDRPVPHGPGGCFSARGCDGCSKIATRPW